MKKHWRFNTNNKNIQSGHKNGIGIEKCAIPIMRTGKRQITERIEQPNQERIRSLGKERKPTSTREYWKRTPSNI